MAGALAGAPLRSSRDRRRWDKVVGVHRRGLIFFFSSLIAINDSRWWRSGKRECIVREEGRGFPSLVAIPINHSSRLVEGGGEVGKGSVSGERRGEGGWGELFQILKIPRAFQIPKWRIPGERVIKALDRQFKDLRSLSPKSMGFFVMWKVLVDYQNDHLRNVDQVNSRRVSTTTTS